MNYLFHKQCLYLWHKILRMRLVERHIVKDNRFEDICLKSGLLYNYVLFNVRQGIFSGDYINEYEFSTKLCKENQVDFRNLPSVVSQQVVAQVFSVTKSWMKSKKEYEKNPSKFLSRPKLPKYKKTKPDNGNGNKPSRYRR